MKKRKYTKAEIKKMKKIVKEYKKRKIERLFIKIVESDFMFIVNSVAFCYLINMFSKAIVEKLFL